MNREEEKKIRRAELEERDALQMRVIQRQRREMADHEEFHEKREEERRRCREGGLTPPLFRENAYPGPGETRLEMEHRHHLAMLEMRHAHERLEQELLDEPVRRANATDPDEEGSCGGGGPEGVGV
jgi:hypothetical protein